MPSKRVLGPPHFPCKARASTVILHQQLLADCSLTVTTDRELGRCSQIVPRFGRSCVGGQLVPATISGSTQQLRDAHLDCGKAPSAVQAAWQLGACMSATDASSIEESSPPWTPSLIVTQERIRAELATSSPAFETRQAGMTPKPWRVCRSVSELSGKVSSLSPLSVLQSRACRLARSVSRNAAA